ncbi:MAG: SufD family Fe-S cluster assembly protein, partial [Verrucomicrobia bacterium]|nr:SufD family Fe-S cluster assembly protein [Verrucomicrobiota bacterium]
MTAILEQMSILERKPESLAGVPEWFSESRAEGWRQFLELPMPARKNEKWRFASLGNLQFEGVMVPPEAKGEGHYGAKGLEVRAARFGFVNDTLVESESHVPEGVICMPLRQALEEHSELVREHFMRQETTLGSAKFSALHRANVSTGMFIHVPAGVVVEDPIEVFHWLEGENVVAFPHTLVVVGENAKVSVVDYFQSDSKVKGSWAIAVNDLAAAEGAQLTYLALQDLCEEARMIQVNNTVVGKDATAKAFILNAGASWARQESLSRLAGTGSHSDMLSVSIGREGQEYDQRTFQHHASPHSYSDLLYKNTLYDKSRTVFSGVILVDKEAHYTDAYQTCRNLMMSGEAEANSMP